MTDVSSMQIYDATRSVQRRWKESNLRVSCLLRCWILVDDPYSLAVTSWQHRVFEEHSTRARESLGREGKGTTKPRCCIRNWIKRDKDNAMLENRESKRSKNRTEIRVKFEEFSRERVGKSCEFIRWMDVSLSFTDVYGKYTSGKGATRIVASWH